jgi:FkbM family methyltransferase
VQATFVTGQPRMCWPKVALIAKRREKVLPMPLETPTHDLTFGAFAPTGLNAWLLSLTRAQPESWFGRRLAFLLRRLVILRLGGKPLDVTSFGARMRLFPYNNVCEKRILFTPQYFDVKEREILAQHFRDDFVFVDVGANIGGYALFVAANTGPRARILAVEPQTAVFERLVNNIQLNAFATVKAVACAVADKNGELTLFMDLQNQGESSVKIVSADGRGRSVKVPARTLFSLLQDEGITRLDAAKLDVEGAEDLILETFFRDAPETLWPSLLVLENGGDRWNVDIPKLLKQHGYRALATTRTNTVFRRG